MSSLEGSTRIVQLKVRREWEEGPRALNVVSRPFPQPTPFGTSPEDASCPSPPMRQLQDNPHDLRLRRDAELAVDPF